MNARELKALQAPIRERYKSDPGAAVVRLRAEGVDSDAGDEQKKTLVELTERHRVVLQTIRNSPRVAISC